VEVLFGWGRVVTGSAAGWGSDVWLVIDDYWYIDGVRHWWVDRVASVVNSAWRSTNQSQTITKPKTSGSRVILGTGLLFPEKKNQNLSPVL
jgi:hypothetical protein